MPSWNRGHFVGQKPPLKPHEVWSIRTRLQVSRSKRDLALFNFAIDSTLRGCDLVALTVGDVALSGIVRDRAVIVQRKTGRPVQFEIGADTTRSRCLDRASPFHRKGLPVPKPRASEATSVDKTVRQDCRQVGFEHRA